MASWVLVGGRCRFCRAPIPRLHSIGELFGAGIGLAALILPAPESWIVAIWGWLLLTAALIDVITMRIPDWVCIIIAATGALSLSLRAEAVWAPIIGALVAWAGFLALARAYQASRGRPGLGEGDAKLVGAAALFIPPLLLPWAIVVASAFGLVWSVLTAWRAPGRAVNRLMPFGPCLAAGFWLVSWAR